MKNCPHGSHWDIGVETVEDPGAAVDVGDTDLEVGDFVVEDFRFSRSPLELRSIRRLRHEDLFLSSGTDAGQMTAVWQACGVCVRGGGSALLPRFEQKRQGRRGE